MASKEDRTEELMLAIMEASLPGIVDPSGIVLRALGNVYEDFDDAADRQSIIQDSLNNYISDESDANQARINIQILFTTIGIEPSAVPDTVSGTFISDAAQGLTQWYSAGQLTAAITQAIRQERAVATETVRQAIDAVTEPAQRQAIIASGLRSYIVGEPNAPHPAAEQTTRLEAIRNDLFLGLGLAGTPLPDTADDSLRAAADALVGWYDALPARAAAGPDPDPNEALVQRLVETIRPDATDEPAIRQALSAIYASVNDPAQRQTLITNGLRNYIEGAPDAPADAAEQALRRATISGTFAPLGVVLPDPASDQFPQEVADGLVQWYDDVLRREAEEPSAPDPVVLDLMDIINDPDISRQNLVTEVFRHGQRNSAAWNGGQRATVIAGITGYLDGSWLADRFQPVMDRIGQFAARPEPIDEAALTELRTTLIRQVPFQQQAIERLLTDGDIRNILASDDPREELRNRAQAQLTEQQEAFRTGAITPLLGDTSLENYTETVIQLASAGAGLQADPENAVYADRLSQTARDTLESAGWLGNRADAEAEFNRLAESSRTEIRAEEIADEMFDRLWRDNGDDDDASRRPGEQFEEAVLFGMEQPEAWSDELKAAVTAAYAKKPRELMEPALGFLAAAQRTDIYDTPDTFRKAFEDTLVPPDEIEKFVPMLNQRDEVRAALRTISDQMKAAFKASSGIELSERSLRNIDSKSRQQVAIIAAAADPDIRSPETLENLRNSHRDATDGFTAISREIAADIERGIPRGEVYFDPAEVFADIVLGVRRDEKHYLLPGNPGMRALGNALWPETADQGQAALEAVYMTGKQYPGLSGGDDPVVAVTEAFSHLPDDHPFKGHGADGISNTTAKAIIAMLAAGANPAIADYAGIDGTTKGKLTSLGGADFAAFLTGKIAEDKEKADGLAQQLQVIVIFPPAQAMFTAAYEAGKAGKSEWPPEAGMRNGIRSSMTSALTDRLVERQDVLTAAIAGLDAMRTEPDITQGLTDLNATLPQNLRMTGEEIAAAAAEELATGRSALTEFRGTLRAALATLNEGTVAHVAEAVTAMAAAGANPDAANYVQLSSNVRRTLETYLGGEENAAQYFQDMVDTDRRPERPDRPDQSHSPVTSSGSEQESDGKSWVKFVRGGSWVAGAGAAGAGIAAATQQGDEKKGIRKALIATSVVLGALAAAGAVTLLTTGRRR